MFLGKLNGTRMHVKLLVSSVDWNESHCYNLHCLCISFLINWSTTELKYVSSSRISGSSAALRLFSFITISNE